MAAPNRAGVLHGTVAVPVAAALLLALTWGRDPPASLVACRAFLGAPCWPPCTTPRWWPCASASRSAP